MVDKDFKKFAFDMGNVGAEVSRLLNWQKIGEGEQTKNCLLRALDLLDQMINENSQKPLAKELLYLREILCAKVFLPNEYRASESQLKNYFLPFAILARTWD
ncbi:MAG: hypothetical protein Q8P84_04280 [Deltaproteobacteria bacterium]|nr:hypothetical protein [Deltaproteobacteria bacterium]MDZ4244126.1 hypothetical protein [Candidatus Doudnabacteria bacterium]